MSSRQYAVAVTFKFRPAQIAADVVRTQLEGLLVDPMLRHALSDELPGWRHLFDPNGSGVSGGSAQIRVWLYYDAASPGDAYARKRRLEELVRRPIVLGVIASRLPYVTWDVGEPAAVPG